MKEWLEGNGYQILSFDPNCLVAFKNNSKSVHNLMNTKKALELIKKDLLEEKQCVLCSIEECMELLESLEDQLEKINYKIEAIEKIEKSSSLRLVK